MPVANNIENITGDDGNITWAKVAQATLALLQVILVYMGLRVFSNLNELNTSVTRIEANRFTSKDGLELLQRCQAYTDKQTETAPEVTQSILRNGRDIERLQQKVDQLYNGRYGGNSSGGN